MHSCTALPTNLVRIFCHLFAFYCSFSILLYLIIIVPEAPSAIKAVVSSDNAVVISWLPPRKSNGILTKYTVYIRVLEQGSEVS